MQEKAKLCCRLCRVTVAFAVLFSKAVISLVACQLAGRKTNTILGTRGSESEDSFAAEFLWIVDRIILLKYSLILISAIHAKPLLVFFFPLGWAKIREEPLFFLGGGSGIAQIHIILYYCYWVMIWKLGTLEDNAEALLTTASIFTQDNIKQDY